MKAALRRSHSSLELSLMQDRAGPLSFYSLIFILEYQMTFTKYQVLKISYLSHFFQAEMLRVIMNLFIHHLKIFCVFVMTFHK